MIGLCECNITSLIIILALLIAISKGLAYLDSRPKKEFAGGVYKTNILITGAAQGIGKLLAQKFVSIHRLGEINLILLDV